MSTDDLAAPEGSRPSRPSRLDLAIDTSVPHRPTVRVLVDGEEVLRPDGEERAAPDDLLASGALVPTDPPRRIALYGCGCGDFGCSNVAALVTREGGRVGWRDFRTVTGAYGAPLPAVEDLPDPVDAPVGPLEDPYGGRPLGLPDLVFDAAQYVAEVARATADRSWEVRSAAVCRVARDRLDGWVLWPDDQDAVQLTRDFHAAEVPLVLPAGDPDALVTALAAVLRTPEAQGLLDDTRWTPDTDRRWHQRRVQGASRVLTQQWAEAAAQSPR